GGSVETGQRVTGLELSGKRVRGVRVGGAVLAADRVVIAAGVHSRRLLRPYGIALPVQPAKGYSVTIDASGLAGTPRIPVLDDTLHAGVTPLAKRLRLVGTAEFAGYDTRVDPVRIDNLFDMLKALFPAVEAGLDRQSAIPWAGLRPMSADGKPLIGATTLEGLYVNAGHGHLGWTMAAGSAELLADLMQGARPAIDPDAFALAGR
ncbi:MAG: FAD-dependent oxidoreductase, partial [Woeseiaceae bacterium]